MLDTSNQLHCSYHTYQARQVRVTCQEISGRRRTTLREEIITRANLIGIANPQAYKAALIALR